MELLTLVRSPYTNKKSPTHKQFSTSVAYFNGFSCFEYDLKLSFTTTTTTSAYKGKGGRYCPLWERLV